MRAGKGEGDAVGFNLEDQPQVQSDTHFKVVLHEFADAQPGMLMRMAEHRLQEIDCLSDLDPYRLGIRADNLPETLAEKNIATHDYRRSLSRLPLYRRRRPRLLSAVNSESIRLAARFNFFLVKPYSCNA